MIASRPVDSFLDLKVGDYVVHVAHGIAKFTGMQTIAKDRKSEEYLTLRFAENATLHVPAALVPGLTRERLEDASFYELLERDYGVVIASGMQSIEPTVTNEEESELLGVPLHSPAFLFERTSRTENGETVEFVRSLYRGDRYRLVAELSQRRDRPTSLQPALVGAE